MSFQLPILVLITFLVAQLINFINDQFILLGICKLIQTFSEQSEDDKLKQIEDGEKYKNSIFRKTIKNFFSAGFFKIFPSITNLGSYILALFNIFMGIFMIIYFLVLLIKIWRFWSMQSYGCFTSIFNSQRTFIYFGVAILLNFLFILYFYFLNGRIKAQKNYQLKMFNQFRYDFTKLLNHTKPAESENTILNINHSISRLRTFLIIDDYNYLFSIFCLILLNLFFILFVLISIFS